MRRWVLAWAVSLGCGSPPDPRGGDTPPGSTTPPTGATGPLVHTDTFEQVEGFVVDVLFVVDNSAEMLEEQAALAAMGPGLFDRLAASVPDFHVGVVSTDMDDDAHRGKLRQADGVRWVDATTADPSGVFASLVSVGDGGSSTERGRDATYAALEMEGDAYNAGFEREDAELHVVVLSNEDDHSSISNVAEMITFLQTRKWEPEQTQVSSIVPLVGDACSDAGVVGDQYVALTEAVGGVTWSVCDLDDPDALLDALAARTPGPMSAFPLTYLPLPDTIEVRVIVEPVTFVLEPGLEFSYDDVANRVIVDETPPQGSRIEVAYEVADRWRRG